MNFRITRRQLTCLLGALPLAAQVTAPAPQKADKAKNDVREASERLASIEVPMNVEPAFSFSAIRD